MADKEPIAKLNDVIKVWNEWKRKKPLFKSVILHGVGLQNADLQGVDFHGTDLSGVDFTNANFQGVNLNDVDLSGAKLQNANLQRTKLRFANMQGADLQGANLQGADLQGANLQDAKIQNANLNAVYLQNANLLNANLYGAFLTRAQFYETIFTNTNLTNVTGLELSKHTGPSNLDHRTLEQSGQLPIHFLRGCGLPDRLIDYLPSLLNQPILFYSCFISYSHADRVFARRLHDQLQGRGIRCWLDEHQLLPGDDIYERVDQGIKLWDKVLLCASKDSLTSWWVDNEIDAAFVKEQQLMKQRGRKVWSLIPLNIDDYLFTGNWERGMAGQVKSRLAADFTGWTTDNRIFEQAFERVVKALKTDDAGREPAPDPQL